ncbi:MAG: hypothetical protein ACI8TQ_000975 [Planctomycetota bacterium]|jgi:hypothetical protein
MNAFEPLRAYLSLGLVSTRVLKSFRLVALAIASSLALAATASATQESFALSPSLNSDLLIAQGDVSGPEGEWGRTKSVLAGSGVVALTPNDESLDSQRIIQILTLSKDLYTETVAASTGAIGGWLSAETLYAVEYELFGTSDPVSMPSAGQYLGSVATLTGLDAAGQPATLGQMYCYDLAKYNARVAALAPQTGGGLSAQTRLYPGPVLQASGAGRFTLNVQAENTALKGMLWSNGGVRLAGQNNSVPNRLHARGTIDITGTGHTYGAQVTETSDVALIPTERTAAQYEALASANSTFFNSSVTLVVDGAGGVETSQGLPVTGVVYAAGDITVAFSGVTVSLTLIAEGSIEIFGSNNNIDAAVDDLLVWAVADPTGGQDNDVLLSGDTNTFAGRLHAPGGAVNISGDDYVITGALSGWKVLIDGDGHIIGDGTD